MDLFLNLMEMLTSVQKQSFSDLSLLGYLRHFSIYFFHWHEKWSKIVTLIFILLLWKYRLQLCNYWKVQVYTWPTIWYVNTDRGWHLPWSYILIWESEFIYYINTEFVVGTCKTPAVELVLYKKIYGIFWDFSEQLFVGHLRISGRKFGEWTK